MQSVVDFLGTKGFASEAIIGVSIFDFISRYLGMIALNYF